MQKGMNQTLAWIVSVLVSALLFSGIYVLIMRGTSPGDGMTDGGDHTVSAGHEEKADHGGGHEEKVQHGEGDGKTVSAHESPAEGGAHPKSTDTEAHGGHE